MEKYSRFRDAATGIAPFLNNKPPAFQAGLSVHLGQILLGAVLFVPLTLAILSYVLVLQNIPVIGKLVLDFVVLRLLRLFYISFKYENERKLSTRKEAVQRVKPGDVILSNFVSPLDPLVFAFGYNVRFAFPTEDGKFVQLRLPSAVMQALAITPVKCKSAQDLDQIVKEAHAEKQGVVVFVEGTTSNGRGLLSLSQTNFSALPKIDDADVWTAAIKYTPSSVASPQPSSLLAYLWRVTTNAWWLMASVRFSQQPLAKSEISAEGVSKSLCSVGRLRQLDSSFGIGAKREFCKALATNSKR